MPNIVIVGFKPLEAKDIRRQTEILMAEMGEADEAVTTILPAVTKFCNNHRRAPYLIVRDSNRDRAKEIATKLNAKLNLDVEFEAIDGFIPAKT